MFRAGAGALLVRFCLAGPLLYIGLVLVTDLRGVVLFAAEFSRALESFQNRSRIDRPNLPEASAFTRFVMRGIGVALCLIAVIFLSGIAG